MSDVEQWERDEQRAMEQEIAMLRKQLETAKVSAGFSELAVNELNADVASWKQRAEASEAQLAAVNKRLEEAEKQEPVAFWFSCNDPNGSVLRTERMLPHDRSGYEPLYTRPIPPADVQELERFIVSKSKTIGELQRQLSKVREEGRKEAGLPEWWREELLLIEAILKGYPVGFAQSDAMRAVRRLLAAAPSPASLNAKEGGE